MTEKSTDTATSSWNTEKGWSAELKASINLKVVKINPGIGYSSKWGTGQENSSSVETTIERTFGIQAGVCCGQKVDYYVLFSRFGKGDVKVKFTPYMICKGPDGKNCNGDTPVPVDTKACEKSIGVQGTRYYWERRSCELECQKAFLHKCCKGISRTSGTRADCNLDKCSNCP